MSRFRRFVAEPMVQFLAAGALIFVLHGALRDDEPDSAPESIVVSSGRVAQIVEIFSRTWQRPPSEAELTGLIDAYVREEVFYREARNLGLDEDDTIVRRRLQQKMEFIIEPDEASLTPAPGELEAFLAANRDSYAKPGTTAFHQLFFDPARHGDSTEAKARAVLATLASAGVDVPPELGDPSLLPPAMPPSLPRQIASSFGEKFADGLAPLPLGRWSGPVASSYGLHLVHVDAREEPRDPTLAEVEAAVLRDWQSRKRREIAEARYAALLARYVVVIESSPPRDAVEPGQ